MAAQGSGKTHLIQLATGMALAVAMCIPATVAHASPITGEPNDQALITRYGKGIDLMGGKTVQPNVRGLTPEAPHRFYRAEALPTSYSLKKYAVPVGDQQAVGACVSWAIGYSMLGWYAMYQGRYQTYAPMFIYSQTHLSKDKDGGGSSAEDTYDILTQQGIPLQKDYAPGNYNWRTKPNAAQHAAAAANTITSPHWLYNLDDNDTTLGNAAQQAIETAISHKHPVALSIELFKPFYRLTTANSTLRASQVTGADAAFLGGHEVLIVGYNPTGVVIQNQWGSDWGDNGFATLDWAYVKKYSMAASWIAGFTGSNPGQVPAAVNGLTATTSGDGGSVNLTWDGTGAYDDMGKHPVTDYVINMRGDDGSVQTEHFARDKSNHPGGGWYGIAGLDPAVTYTVDIHAVNAIGDGPVTNIPLKQGVDATYGPLVGADTVTAAKPAAKVLPAVAPDSPRRLNLVQYTNQLGHTVNVFIGWQAPKSTGRSVITGYTVKFVGKNKAGKSVFKGTRQLVGSTRSIRLTTGTVGGQLRIGLTYTFTVLAKNGAGYVSNGISAQTYRLR